MKTLKLITIFFTLFCLLSCKKDIDPVSSPDKAKEFLVGTWKYSVIDRIVDSDDPTKVENIENHYKITRRNDGSLTEQSIHIHHNDKNYSYIERNGIWTIRGTYYYVEYPVDDYNFTFKFKIVKLSRDIFSFVRLHSVDEILTELEIDGAKIESDHRVAPDYTLPTPPKGYTLKKLQRIE